MLRLIRIVVFLVLGASGFLALDYSMAGRWTGRAVEGLTFTELEDSDVCCGFGGTFSVKYSDLSGAIVDKKAVKVEASRATTLLAGDLGCLMNMAGKLQREGSAVQVRHVAEVLAGMGDLPAIGEPERS